MDERNTLFNQARLAAAEGRFPDWQEYLHAYESEDQQALLSELLEVFISERSKLGKPISPGDFAANGTEVVNLAVEILEQNRRLETMDESGSQLGQTPLVVQHADSPSPSSGLSTPPVEIREGSWIGPYKLLQKIGEGGMGAVWMAQQETPVRRRVAVKVIKSELSSRQVIARFEAERQALAMMDHQNIARVLDAGTTPDGAPYFVMELVKGVPLTQFCDDHKLNVAERLRLFLPVCKALQHAHQKGIIHRDIKPSNVLVALYDGSPVPKVIDFGLAKALEQSVQLTEKTMFTRFGQVVGTLQYMSPEQAEMNQLDVDTRSDIYSLGVMLYELLSGSTPIEAETLQKQAMLEVLETIRKKDPPTPSHRLSSSNAETVSGISRQRSITPSRLRTILRGELDWVVMKALEKDRSRRYDSASGLADDIERYLNNDTIEARPPSALYRLSKFASRNRGLVGSMVVAAMLLVLGISVSSWFAWDAYVAKQNFATKAADEESQRRIAEQKTAEAQHSALVAEQARKKAQEQTRVAQLAEQNLEKRLQISAIQTYAANMQQVLLAQDSNAFDLAQELLQAETGIERGWEYRFLRARQKLFVPWQPQETLERGGISINAVADVDQLYYCWAELQRVDLSEGKAQQLKSQTSFQDELLGIDLSPDKSRLALGLLGGGTQVLELDSGRSRTLGSSSYDWIIDLAAMTDSRLESCARSIRLRPRFINNDSIVFLQPNVLTCISTDGKTQWSVASKSERSYGTSSLPASSPAQELWRPNSGNRANTTPDEPPTFYEKDWFHGFNLSTNRKRIAVWMHSECWIYDSENGKQIQHFDLQSEILDAVLVDDDLVVATKSDLREYSIAEASLTKQIDVPNVVQIEPNLRSKRYFVLQDSNGTVSSLDMNLSSTDRQRWLDLNFSDFAFFGVSADGRFLLYNNGNGWCVRAIDAAPSRVRLSGQSIERVWELDDQRFLVAKSLPPETELSILSRDNGTEKVLGRVRGVIRDLKVRPDGRQASVLVHSLTIDLETRSQACLLDIAKAQIVSQYEFEPGIASCLSANGEQLLSKTQQGNLEHRSMLDGKVVKTSTLTDPRWAIQFDEKLEDPFEDSFGDSLEFDQPSDTEVWLRKPSALHQIEESSIVLDTTVPGALGYLDLATGKTDSFKIDEAGVLGAARFHPTRPWLYLAYSDANQESGAKVLASSKLCCLDMDTGELRFVKPSHLGLTRDMRIHGDRLLTCGDDGTVKVWELETGLKLLSIPANATSVRSLIIEPESDSLWIASSDGLHQLQAESNPATAGKDSPASEAPAASTDRN